MQIIDAHTVALKEKAPIHPALVPIPIICFLGGLITDIAYYRTAEMMWADFSAWLITIGVAMGFVAALAGIFDFINRRLVAFRGVAWPHILSGLLVLALGTFNAMIHSRDAWTSVVPTGIILSAITVLILPVTGLLGWMLADRTRGAVK